MCQMSVVIENDAGPETVMDNVTGLQVTGDGVVLTTFFEEPLSLSDVAISRIDFLGGKVFLNREPVKQ